MNGLLSRRGNGTGRRATAVVEMALITPLLMLILMGIIEFGWLFHIKSSLTTASRMGARTGTMPGATADEVQGHVDEAMEDMALDGYPYITTITMADATSPYVTVAVSVQYRDVSLVGGFFSWLRLNQLRSATTFHHEVEDGGGAP